MVYIIYIGKVVILTYTAYMYITQPIYTLCNICLYYAVNNTQYSTYLSPYSNNKGFSSTSLLGIADPVGRRSRPLYSIPVYI